jgi:chromosome segregation ATPase
VDAQRRIARLERMLAAEVQRRKEVEAEMNRLLQETSAGPYEQATSVVEQHLREQLDRAHREITTLRNTLAGERRSRDEVERRFAALQAQMQSAAAGDAPAPAARSEEVEALKERQRRVLASIEQDLAASKQREAALRQTLESAQGAAGVPLADTVSGLRTENSALQLRLDEEHRRNAELHAKLQLAQRVTDLIFRMQNNAAPPVAAAALPAAP